MTRPPPDALHALARSSNALLPWLREWRQKELEQLPFTSAGNVAVAQGRCQVLTELCRLVQESPDAVAKLRQG
jgi:hypothetical protein